MLSDKQGCICDLNRVILYSHGLKIPNTADWVNSKSSFLATYLPLVYFFMRISHSTNQWCYYLRIQIHLYAYFRPSPSENAYIMSVFACYQRLSPSDNKLISFFPKINEGLIPQLIGVSPEKAIKLSVSYAWLVKVCIAILFSLLTKPCHDHFLVSLRQCCCLRDDFFPYFCYSI